MKRTAISRTTPLARKRMRRTSGQTTRTVKLTSRPKPAVPAAVREAVRLRAGDVCEGCAMRRGTDPHHRQLRSRRGDDALSNVLWLCRCCHDWAHEHPAAATRLGFMVASWEPPETVPVLLHDGRLVGLTDDGGYVVLPAHQTPATQVVGGSEEES